MEITVDILKAIAPGSKKTNYKHLAGLALWMNHWFPLFDIDTIGEIRHFLSQGAHETDSFNALKEYATGEAYDTRIDLGNTPERDGDGQRLKGRGIFMTTGAFNYKKATLEWNESYPDNKKDFFKNPDLLEYPEYAVWSACQYWDHRNFNTFANMPDNAKIPYKAKTKKGVVVLLVNPVEYISRKINGGTRGLSERIKFYERAKEIIK
jgi:putative chitinase